MTNNFTLILVNGVGCSLQTTYIIVYFMFASARVSLVHSNLSQFISCLTSLVRRICDDSFDCKMYAGTMFIQTSWMVEQLMLLSFFLCAGGVKFKVQTDKSVTGCKRFATVSTSTHLPVAVLPWLYVT